MDRIEGGTSRDLAGYDENGNLIWIDPQASGEFGMEMMGQSPDPQSPIGQALQEAQIQGGHLMDLSGNQTVDAGDTPIILESMQSGTVMYLPRTVRISYDYRNQMVKSVYTDSSEMTYVHTYAYDCFGRRFRKVVGMTPTNPNPNDPIATSWTTVGEPGTGLETRFVHGGPDDTGHWQVLEDSGASYVYGNYIDEILNMVRWGNSVYYHQDDLFSVVALTAGPGGVTTYGGQFIAQGAIVEKIWYGDYGKPIPTGIYSSPVGNRFCFTGREWDGETELAYYRTRYLDPMWGRFTTRDSIGTWGDSENNGNAFMLVGSRPTSKLDPFGLHPGDGLSPGDRWIPGHGLQPAVRPASRPYSPAPTDCGIKIKRNRFGTSKSGGGGTIDWGHEWIEYPSPVNPGTNEGIGFYPRNDNAWDDGRFYQPGFPSSGPVTFPDGTQIMPTSDPHTNGPSDFSDPVRRAPGNPKTCEEILDCLRRATPPPGDGYGLTGPRRSHCRDAVDDVLSQCGLERGSP